MRNYDDLYPPKKGVDGIGIRGVLISGPAELVTHLIPPLEPRTPMCQIRVLATEADAHAPPVVPTRLRIQIS